MSKVAVGGEAWNWGTLTRVASETSRSWIVDGIKIPKGHPVDEGFYFPHQVGRASNIFLTREGMEAEGLRRLRGAMSGHSVMEAFRIADDVTKRAVLVALGLPIEKAGF